jgi:hypothetical protein
MCSFVTSQFILYIFASIQALALVEKAFLMAKLCEKEVEVAANTSQAISIIDTACTAPPLITNYIKKRLGMWLVRLRLQNK